MDFLWFLEGLRAPVLTYLFRFITFLGEETIAVGLLCALYWCIDRKRAYAVSVVFFLSALVVQGLKIAVRIERPWILDPTFMPVEAALATATSYSFPSGHTQTAAAIFGTLGLTSRRKGVTVAAWVLVLLIGLSRMYLGVHTPLDVGVSLLITLVIAIATLAYLRADGSDTVLLSVLLAVSVIVLGYALLLWRQGVIDTHYVSDSCKAAGGCVGCAIALLWARRRIPFETETPHLWQQPVKLLIGLAGLIAIQSGLKLIIGASLVADMVRYALIALWALALYPLLFSKVFSAKQVTTP